MSRSLPEMQETCTFSGGMSDNGIRRGLGMLRKWMDGRIVKEDPMERGTCSIMPGTTETLDEGHATIASRRGEGADLLELNRTMTGRSDGGLFIGFREQERSIAHRRSQWDKTTSTEYALTLYPNPHLCTSCRVV